MKLKFPGLKILDRYIIGKFLSTYFLAIAMIIVIVVIFDYAEKLDDFTQFKAPFRAVVMDYYVNVSPFFINQLSGLLTFIAVIFFTSKLAYKTEIVAILSSGTSFRRLMWPYLVGAFIIASISLTLNLWVIPEAQKTRIEFEAQYLARKRNKTFDRHIYRQVEPGTFLYLRNYNATGKATFLALESYEDQSMVASLEAASASLDESTNRWKAPRYVTRSFDSDGKETFTQHRNLDTLINIDRNELGKVNELIKTMPIDELNEFMAQQQLKGSDSIKIIEVERHARYSYPLATFILTIIGVALSSRKVRGGTGLHIGLGIGLCFSYILFTRFFEEFAKSGTMTPALAVWLPNMIYSVVAVVLYSKAQK